MDLSTKTLVALDWPFIQDALAACCQTALGRDAVIDSCFAKDRTEAGGFLAEVGELWRLEDDGDTPPLTGISDVREEVLRTARGDILEPPELQNIGRTLESIVRLAGWFGARQESIPQLRQTVDRIAIDSFLVRHMVDSFTAEGELSDTYYPEIRSLKDQIEGLKLQVRSTLQALLNDASMADAFHDRYITDRGGRLVIPVRVQARRRLGIVHDTSQSGETAFVEPSAVVESQNEIKGLEAHLRRTVAKILTEMSRELGEASPAILAALQATMHLDLASARARLGRRLEATIPDLGTDARIHLDDARHPVLALRGVEVVPNSITLDETRSTLVLTGPNAGGKTITLKTIGLMGIMARAGLPLPVAEGARIGWLDPIVAVVGDHQDIEDDLSTFSSHLVGLKRALSAARPGALILLDEVAIGTDPRQGAALAQAIIEAVVRTGARALITTHYDEVKALAAEHPAMGLMGAVFADGRPTFRMEPGRFGRSHALSVARRMGIDSDIVERARELLDSEVRRMDDLLSEVESERERLREQALSLAVRQKKLDFELTRLDAREAKLNARRDREDAESRALFRAELKAVAKEIRAELKALQAAPTMKAASTLLDKVKAERAAVHPDVAPLPPPSNHEVKVGDRVDLIQMGVRGLVLAVKDQQIEVDVRGKRMRLPRAAVHLAPEKVRQPTQAPPAREPTRSPDGVRTEGNTLDLRGLRVHEALDATEAFLLGIQLSDHGCAYLLHGHGTGAIKTALRQWLPKSAFGRDWRAARGDEGGDAFTVVVFSNS